MSDNEQLDPLAAWERLAGEADRHLAGRLEALPEGGAEVSCRVGCAACCRQLVVVSPLEAHAVARYVEERPALAAAARARLAEYRRRLAAEPELERRLKVFRAVRGYLPGEAGGELEVRYWAAQIPCPFLEEERCTIHPVRPFGCREHFVTSPAELCSLDPDGVTTTDTRLEYRTVANQLGAEAFGIPERQLLLADALDHAAAHPEERERRAPLARFIALAEAAKRRVRLALAALRVKVSRLNV